MGAAGVSYTVTEVVPAAVGGRPGTVAVTEYVPEPAVLTLPIEGFCKVEVKLLGPDQAYVAPVTVLEVSDKVVPEQMVPGPPAVGVEGGGLMTTVVVPAAPGGHPLTAAVTE